MIHYFVLGSMMVMVLVGVEFLLRTARRYADLLFKRYRRHETIPRTNTRSIRASGDPILGFEAWKKMKQ
jgi:hypothetical protein